MNEWKSVWSKRSADMDILKKEDEKKVFLELKRSNGFDVQEEGPAYEAWVEQYRQIKRELEFNKNRDGGSIKSVYEVGCGSGANLYLFEKDGIETGGADYSGQLIESARRALASTDLICEEAVRISIAPMYDAVLSNSVFSYFEDEEYALAVLEKMCRKARHSIGIIDICDREKKEECIAYRKKSIEDYEERYRNLPKLFYSKQFFLEFASKHNIDIKFSASDVTGYWNNNFVFNCYMFKREEV